MPSMHCMKPGLVLKGTEVKSLRQGKANISDAHARFKDGEIFLYNAHISPYAHAAVDSHNPERPRKLLLNRWELRRLLGKTQERGYHADSLADVLQK